jgi:hypothetical protein
MKTLLLKSLLCAVTGFFVLAATSYADPADEMSRSDTKGFNAYLASPAFDARQADFVKMAKGAFFKTCETVTLGERQVRLIKPVRIGDDGQPSDGVWKVSLSADGCGTARLLNAFFLAAQKKVVFLLTYPGTTDADPVLQRDTVMYVLTAASLQGAKCDVKTSLIINTHYDGEEKLSPAPGPAGDKLGLANVQKNETWTAEVCGHFYAVKVKYVRNLLGTNISTSNKEVTEISAEEARKR